MDQPKEAPLPPGSYRTGVKDFRGVGTPNTDAGSQTPTSIDKPPDALPAQAAIEALQKNLAKPGITREEIDQLRQTSGVSQSTFDIILKQLGLA